MHDDKLVFTKDEEKEMITHLREHSELLEQRQGRDIMQNFFVKKPRERYTAIKSVLNELIRLNQNVLEDVNASLRSYKIAEDGITICNSILATYGDEGKPLNQSGLDIPEMRKLVVKNATMIVLGWRYVVEKWVRDQKVHPHSAAKLQHDIDEADHVLMDFSILLTKKFPHSTPYLREFKKKHGIQ